MTRLLLLLILLAPAGDDTKTHKVTCPVDGTTFKATEIVRAYWWGGTDKDWCRHTFRSKPLESMIWTCPGCYYSGGKEKFLKPGTISEALKTKYRDGLKPAVTIKKKFKQEQIPGWAKYDLLAQVQKIRGDDALSIANSYLFAAWAARQEGTVNLLEIDEWTAMKKRYGIHRTPLELGLGKNRAEFEMKQARKLAADLNKGKWKAGANRVMALYLAVYLFRRRGEFADAEAWIAELEKLDGQNSHVDDKLKELKASLPIEKKFQKLAAEKFEPLIDENTGEKKRIELCYMLGEIHRRLGAPDKARGWYEKSLAALESGLEDTKGEARAKKDDKSKRRLFLEGMDDLVKGQHKLVPEKKEKK